MSDFTKTVKKTENPNPSLTDVLNLWKKNILLSLNCHAIGTIESFDSSNQTVSVSINYPKTLYRKKTGEKNSKTNEYESYTINYPKLSQVPTVVISGGTSALTMPIKKGDQCLLLFNDRNIENWWATGQFAEISSSLLHAFGDAIAIVGLFHSQKSLQNYDQNRAVLRNGTSAVGVRDDNGKVLITNNYPTATTTLNSLLQQLITAIKQITVSGVTTGGGVSGVPVNVATFTSIATQLGNLLE